MKSIIYMIGCILAANSVGAYTYEVYTYGSSKTLKNQESILIDLQGGMNRLTLTDDAFAMIRNTSLLEEGFGGIGTILMGINSELYIHSGQVNKIDISHDATAFLSGGQINHIYSYQAAWKYEGQPSELVWNPHITIVYSGDVPLWNPETNILTGFWGDGNDFEIQLHDTGYSPAIENIRFELIPEPTTLVLLGLGGLLIRPKKRPEVLQ